MGVGHGKCGCTNDAIQSLYNTLLFIILSLFVKTDMIQNYINIKNIDEISNWKVRIC